MEEKNLQHWVYILIFQAVVQYGILYSVYINILLGSSPPPSLFSDCGSFIWLITYVAIWALLFIINICIQSFLFSAILKFLIWQSIWIRSILPDTEMILRRVYCNVIVLEYTISEYGSSCNCLFFGLILASLLSLSIPWPPQAGMDAKK